MLKKAGILVAASAASLLAVSPLAFAGDEDGSHHGTGIDKDSEGLLAGVLSGNNVTVPIQACNNNIPVNVLGAQVPAEDANLLSGVTGALGIAGDAEAKSGDSVTEQPDNCGQQAGSGDTSGDGSEDTTSK